MIRKYPTWRIKIAMRVNGRSASKSRNYGTRERDVVPLTG